MFYVFVVTICVILNYNNIIVGDDNVTSTDNIMYTTEKEKELDEYDWDVWCKFQPNGYDCGKTGGARFYYDVKMDGCKTYSYGGCPTTFNSFDTSSACHESCRDAGERAITYNASDKVSCRLQPDFGQCDDYHPMFYYDITLRTCRGFSYSGCGGNNNRFESTQICTAICSTIVAF